MRKRLLWSYGSKRIVIGVNSYEEFFYLFPDLPCRTCLVQPTCLNIKRMKYLARRRLKDCMIEQFVTAKFCGSLISFLADNAYAYRFGDLFDDVDWERI